MKQILIVIALVLGTGVIMAQDTRQLERIDYAYTVNQIMYAEMTDVLVYTEGAKEDILVYEGEVFQDKTTGPIFLRKMGAKQLDHLYNDLGFILIVIRHKDGEIQLNNKNALYLIKNKA